MTNPEVAQNAPLAGSFALCLLGAGDGKVYLPARLAAGQVVGQPAAVLGRFLQRRPARARSRPSATVRLALPAAGDRPGRGGRLHVRAGLAFPESHACLVRLAAAPQRREDRTPSSAITTAQRFARCLGRPRNTPRPTCLRSKSACASSSPPCAKPPCPPPVKDAAMANLSTLATPTCFRTADGKFRGFEGINDDQRLLPRQLHARLELRDHHAASVPHARALDARSGFRTCRTSSTACCRFVSLCPKENRPAAPPPPTAPWARSSRPTSTGNSPATTPGSRKIWPQVKKAMEFAWVRGGWDGDRDGVMEGVQHNTYDVEFYGPNPMCGIYYLGGLRAAEEMARAAGDRPFADECRRLFASGSNWIDANLFNGEYYIQKIRGIPVDKIAKPLQSQRRRRRPRAPRFPTRRRLPGGSTDRTISGRLRRARSAAGSGEYPQDARVHLQVQLSEQPVRSRFGAAHFRAERRGGPADLRLRARQAAAGFRSRTLRRRGPASSTCSRRN